MERKKHYRNPSVQENLYQYEMGIDLGAEIEYDKRAHQKEYEREHSANDFKGANDLNRNKERSHQRNDQMNRR